MSYIAYLDCQNGVSCETLLAALLDAGLSLDVLNQRLASLPLQGYALSLEHARYKETHGTSITLTLAAHGEIRYNVSELEALLKAPQVPLFVRETMLAIVQHLSAAELKISGGASDFTIRLSDLVILIATVIGLGELNIVQVYVSALPLVVGGSQPQAGQVYAPNPVTLELLRGSEAIWKPALFDGEGMTPLAAALLATLARFDVPPPFSIERIGYGAYSPTLSTPNLLRLYKGTTQNGDSHEDEGADTDWVTVLSTNIDNMSGELLGGLMERLFVAGALDVSYTPLQMKKNRPATMLTVICPLERGDELAYILLRETTTLGVRIQHVQRLKAQRTPRYIDTPLGPLLVKVKRLGTKIISAAPEYEECQRIASERHMPLAEVYAIAQHWIDTTIINSEEE